MAAARWGGGVSTRGDIEVVHTLPEEDTHPSGQAGRGAKRKSSRQDELPGVASLAEGRRGAMNGGLSQPEGEAAASQLETAAARRVSCPPFCLHKCLSTLAIYRLSSSSV